MRIKRFLFAAILLGLSFSLFAQQQRIIDDANLLTSAQVSELERKAQHIFEAFNIDLVIVTKTRIEGTEPSAYADAFYEERSFGRDGCLLLQVTGDRDYVFSTTGRAIGLLDRNRAAFNKLESSVVSYLRNDNYYGAYQVYLNVWEEFLTLEADGRRYNFFHQWNVVLVIAAWAVSLLIGFFVVLGWKQQMNTALPKKEADIFMIPGSLSLTVQKDSFLFSNITKIKRETETSSAGSGKGGLRTSASGRSFGGRSGKY